MFEYGAFVTKVIDGDTIEVEADLGFKVHLAGIRLRLRGINAPELEKGTPAERLAGEASKAYLTDLLEGKTVEVETFKTSTGRDRKTFERYVADVTIDGMDVAKLMLNGGHAVPMKG